MERQEALLGALVAEQTRQAQQQGQIIDALADMFDGVSACYAILRKDLDETSLSGQSESAREDGPRAEAAEDRAAASRSLSGHPESDGEENARESEEKTP